MCTKCIFPQYLIQLMDAFILNEAVRTDLFKSPRVSKDTQPN